MPKPESPSRKTKKSRKNAIEPYTQDAIRAFLNSLETSRSYTRPGKRTSSHSLNTTLRNRAFILVLLDTGIRTTELCTLKIQHCDLKNRRIRVFSKGSKERFIPFSSRTGQALWKYLATRPEAPLGESLFLQLTHLPFDRNTLGKTLIRIGKRAGIEHVGVHRFRHTFAINFLRNGISNGGANPWALQSILGHEDIKTVKIYLALAQADTDAAHKVNSPVENWRL